MNLEWSLFLMYLCLLGICGGSASGKTTVATKIIESLNVPWVTLLSMDSFYKVCESIIVLLRYIWYKSHLTVFKLCQICLICYYYENLLFMFATYSNLTYTCVFQNVFVWMFASEKSFIFERSRSGNCILSLNL